MHIMSINPPDPTWYMDTGAISHMTSSNGNFSSYFNLSNHHNGIIVGNDHTIPICGYDHTSLPDPNLPLSLKKVLHDPEINKNPISVRKFTSNNFLTIEIDPFGFSVRDFQTRRQITICDSQGDLYPLTTSKSNQALPSIYTTISPSLWHDCLGHPGSPVLDTLRYNKIIDCNRYSSSSICCLCVLRKHVKLPFVVCNACKSGQVNLEIISIKMIF